MQRPITTGWARAQTYISSILISLNPFKLLPIYSPAVMDEYRAQLAQRLSPPPHVYALADDTYRSLVSDRQDQSVIISG
jgi:myosin-1